MMATQTVKGYAYMEFDYNETYSEKVWLPTWKHYELDDTAERVCLGEQTITLEIPDDFDPRAKAIAALEEQKRDLAAKFSAAVNEINARISKLQAIEHDA